MEVLGPAGYAIRTKTELPYEEAVVKTREALKAQGFGVLTEIDVRKTLKEKLGIDYRPYIILGACNPTLAHRAIEAEPDIGTLLPCSVIVYEQDGGSVIAAMNPDAVTSTINNPDLEPIATEVTERLRLVIDELSPKG